MKKIIPGTARRQHLNTFVCDQEPTWKQEVNKDEIYLKIVFQTHT